MTMASESPNNSEEKKNDNARAMFYKKPIKKYNYKLDSSMDDTPQEIRRHRLLQIQKNNRHMAFNNARGILENVLMSEDEEDEEDDVEVFECKAPKTYRSNWRYANQLMLSEWMLEVPEDFISKWILVPCPVGRRSLVVACKGITKAYNRRGHRLGKFRSALPGGNPDEHRNSCTILDCIWIKEHKIYYVLDVLAWSNQPFLNCEAEFRFYWLKSQFLEIEALQERGTHKNTFPLLLLPNIRCNEHIYSFLESLVGLPPLDGILFYHAEGHYTKGYTPLVTWLKSFMLPEVLGIMVPPPLEDKPDGYVEFRQYISQYSKRGKRKQKVWEDQMEVTDIDH